LSNASARAGLLDEFRFLRSLVIRPRAIGAIAPSSPALARLIAQQVDPAQPGRVLELGPGTGVITEALIARGVAPDRLIAIEADPDLAGLMEQRFAGVRILRADAYDLEHSLAGEPQAPLAAIVSGLPLLNESVSRRQGLLTSVFALLAPGAPFVQFSYRLKPPVPAPAGVSVTRAALILLNLPPARVWVYRRA
jgi:phosphatidylethanolamine/phosphatidyl-N-methylethanolamine N-methyltransferase